MWRKRKRGLDSVLPYLKATLDVSDGSGIAEPSATPVTRPFVGSLLTTYVLDEESRFRFVTEADAAEAGRTVDQLHQRAIANLAALVAQQELRTPKFHAITPVIFDGNLEVSFMLFDELWTSFEERFGEPEILAVAPARDILAFCPASSDEGRKQLGELVDRIWPGGDHLLTRDFYRRVDGAWQLDEA
ncbi:hypothetical protein DFJ67_1157 [Asanoa ferruginea]|uniref:DUF1444 family protein n=1 Tax=Asanoa ferruginea TaxID=53367 RepID=A0A3D9ZD57_9ACTN|nr:hypothetical protein [Asanoa ferruginea]REF95205.1 hypothetical protein DFJ67_1157 [Asanoa ferruginea]GIF52809.1 hypothetical protein Afe04nite_73480 [Asanoa ferruginea]